MLVFRQPIIKKAEKRKAREKYFPKELVDGNWQDRFIGSVGWQLF
jgi:hypothetical protein